MKQLIEYWEAWRETKGAQTLLVNAISPEEITAGFFLATYGSPMEAADAVYRHRFLGNGFYVRVWGILFALTEVP